MIAVTNDVEFDNLRFVLNALIVDQKWQNLRRVTKLFWTGIEGIVPSKYYFILFYFNYFFGHIHMSYFRFLVTSLWDSKPEWVLPYLHCGGECNVHSLSHF